MIPEGKVLFGGSWVEAKKSVEIKAPYDGKIAGVAGFADADQLEEAVKSAVQGFKTTKTLPTHTRYEILSGIADGLKTHKEKIARTLAQEAGKPLKAARSELDRAHLTFTTAAEETKRIEGEVLSLDLDKTSEGRFGIVKRFPIGPIYGISPFNFPMNLVAHKVAPAIASSNSILLKPASQTPLTALALGQLCMEAGVPAGGVNVIPCSSSIADKLIEDDRFAMLTFTGSPAIGWDLKARSGKKRVTLELGGNAGVLVDSDADLDYAAARIATGGFYYAGQSCISVQRVFVQNKVYDQFMDKFVKQVKALKTGNPLDESTDVGPIISKPEAERIEQWIKEAKDQGAKILTGGDRDGTIIQPTVIENTKPEMKVRCLEIFGPVVTVNSFDRFDEAVDSINNSAFGLQAGIFSNRSQEIFRAFDKLDIGGIIVGDVPTWRSDPMPYGGVKDSGFGREGLKYAIEEMTERKIMVFCK